LQATSSVGPRGNAKLIAPPIVSRAGVECSQVLSRLQHHRKLAPKTVPQAVSTLAMRGVKPAR
jgi:hypothetical protein